MQLTTLPRKEQLSIDLYNQALESSFDTVRREVINILWERKEYEMIKSLAINYASWLKDSNESN